jgi:TnsA endonuclease N terminal
MRQRKRPTTPRLLDLFRRQERGLGTHAEYVAWHRVRRSDPPSPGRSHLHRFNARQLDLMSDLELIGFLFVTQLPGLLDIREQFPLSLLDAPHELAAYDIARAGGAYPGTLRVARELGRRHPHVHDEQTREPKVLSTKHLLTLQNPDGRRSLLAVSYQWRRAKRMSAAAEIERLYWQARDVPWMLVTRDEFDRRVGLTLRRTACWALSPPAPSDDLEAALTMAYAMQGRSLTALMQRLFHALGDMDRAQCAFWQCVWRGLLPLDLRRGWRPTEPLQLMPHDRWIALNPIASRRSAWN